MKELILIRGVSGSGKSTFAELVARLACQMHDHLKYKEIHNMAKSWWEKINQVTVSADDYFTDTNGNYDFNPADLPKAHAYCQNIVDMSMKQAKIDDERGNGSIILVHNTFTTEREMEPYFEMAKEFGYKVTTLIVENRHESNSIHNVPDYAIERQKDRFNIKL